MATLSYELGKPKRDGSRKVSIILSHKGRRRRIPTAINVEANEISRSGKIASKKILKAIQDKIKLYNDRLYELDSSTLDVSLGIDSIYRNISNDKESMDFFQFTESWLNRSEIKAKKNYTTMLNALRKYTKTSSLLFTDINYSFLKGFEHYLKDHPRAQSLYLGEMRHIFNEAMREYNNEYKKLIPSSPFEHFKIPKHIADTKNRVISEEDLVKVFNFRGTRRVGMARDCYVLSFCLMGMNSIDMYECTELKGNVISYNRAKTKDRRKDHAHIEIEVPGIVLQLLHKYKGKSRVFDFYTRYTNASNFNKHINKGLGIISKRLGIPKFDFYSARHTWASIARNKLGIDKYTIHEALNHASELDITDIYIQKDYSNINKANQKVMEYITKLLDNK